MGRHAHAENPEFEFHDAWRRLAGGKTLGKRVVVPFKTSNSAGGFKSPDINLFRVDSKDEDACQLCVTLVPPEIFSTDTVMPADVQKASGSYDNVTLGATSNNTGVNPVANAANPMMDIPFANVTAILEWGICGINHRAEIDWANGTCINVVASSIHLRAQIEQGPGSLANANYQLGAFVGPGIPRPNSAKRTIPIGNIANGTRAASVFAVPRFARAVTLVASDSNGTPMAGTISFYRSLGGFADLFGVADYVFAGNSQNQQPVPIPAGAYYFQVIGQYAGAGGNPFYNAVFDLAI